MGLESDVFFCLQVQRRWAYNWWVGGGDLASGSFTVLHTMLSAKSEFVCNDMLVYLDHPIIMKFPSLYCTRRN